MKTHCSLRLRNNGYHSLIGSYYNNTTHSLICCRTYLFKFFNEILKKIKEDQFFYFVILIFGILKPISLATRGRQQEHSLGQEKKEEPYMPERWLLG